MAPGTTRSRRAATTDVDADAREEALKIAGDLTPLPLAHLRLLALDTITGRVMHGGDDVFQTDPLVQPGEGAATSAAMLYRLRRTFPDLTWERVEEVAQGLRGRDLLKETGVPTANFNAAGRPRRHYMSAFDQVTTLGLRVAVASFDEEGQLGAPVPEAMYGLLDASAALDEALSSVVGAYLTAEARALETGLPRVLPGPYDTSLYRSLQVLDLATAREVESLRRVRDELVQGRLPAAFSPSLRSATRALRERVAENRPRLAVVLRHLGAIPERGPIFEIHAINFGFEGAEDAEVTFVNPGGYGVHEGGKGGWVPTTSSDRQRVHVGSVNMLGHRLVGEYRRRDGHPAKGNVVRWEIQSKNGRPVDGEFRFEPSQLERR